MGVAFHDTVYGRNFFQNQIPELTKNLGRIAGALERKETVRIMHCTTDLLVDGDIQFQKGEVYFFVPTNDSRCFATFKMDAGSEGRCWMADMEKYFEEKGYEA